MKCVIAHYWPMNLCHLKMVFPGDALHLPLGGINFRLFQSTVRYSPSISHSCSFYLSIDRILNIIGEGGVIFFFVLLNFVSRATVVAKASFVRPSVRGPSSLTQVSGKQHGSRSNHNSKPFFPFSNFSIFKF